MVDMNRWVEQKGYFLECYLKKTSNVGPIIGSNWAMSEELDVFINAMPALPERVSIY